MGPRCLLPACAWRSTARSTSTADVRTLSSHPPSHLYLRVSHMSPDLSHARQASLLSLHAGAKTHIPLRHAPTEMLFLAMKNCKSYMHTSMGYGTGTFPHEHRSSTRFMTANLPTEMSSSLSHDRQEDQVMMQRGQSVHCMRYTMVLLITLTLDIQPHRHG